MKRCTTLYLISLYRKLKTIHQTDRQTDGRRGETDRELYKYRAMSYIGRTLRRTSVRVC